MKDKSKTLAVNIGIFTIGSFGSKILCFLLVPLYTSILSTEDYGNADLLTTTVSLLIPILTLSIQDAVLRFSLDKEKAKTDVINSALRVLTKGFIVLFIAVGINKLFDIVSVSDIFSLFVLLLFVSGTLNTSFNLYLRGENNVKIIAISGISNTLIMCSANILFLTVFHLGLFGYLLSIFAGETVSISIQFVFGKIYKDLRFKKYNKLGHEMITYSMPLVPNSLAWWINTASDRYILAFLNGVAANGIYAIAYKIPTMLTIFQTIFNNAWSISAITEFDKSDEDGFLGSNYKRYSLLSYLACSGLILFNIPIASILYSNDFFFAWKAVPFLLVGTVFNGISIFEGSLYAAAKKTKMVSMTTIIGALVNTIFNFTLIPFIGYLGAAIATMIGYIVTWIMRTIFLQKIIEMKVNWKIEIISYVAIVIQAVLATLNSFILIQGIIIGLVLALNRKYIFDIVRYIYCKLCKK